MEKAGVVAVQPTTRIGDDRLIDIRPEEVAPADRAIGIIFERELVAVVEKARVGGRTGHPPQPAERIVCKGRRLRPARADQPVFNVVDEGRRAVRGQIAVGVVGEACRTRGGVLVEAVGRVVRPGG